MHYHPHKPDGTPDGDSPELPEVHDNYGPEAAYAVEAEAGLPTTKWEEEIARGLELGLQGADSIVDQRIPTFTRGELPHFAGINTFLKAPYVEDVRRCGEYDVAVLGAPVRRRHDLPLRHALRAAGHPQDLGALRPVQLRARRRPARVDHDRRPRRHLHHPRRTSRRRSTRSSKAVAHVYETGAFPVVLGGDHSIGYPTVRGVAAAPERRQARHHPLRPPRRHAGDRPRRAHAHHAVVPRHGHPQRAGQEPGADRHRRLAGAAARRARSAASAARRS